MKEQNLAQKGVMDHLLKLQEQAKKPLEVVKEYQLLETENLGRLMQTLGGVRDLFGPFGSGWSQSYGCSASSESSCPPSASMGHGRNSNSSAVRYPALLSPTGSSQLSSSESSQPSSGELPLLQWTADDVKSQLFKASLFDMLGPACRASLDGKMIHALTETQIDTWVADRGYRRRTLK